MKKITLTAVTAMLFSFLAASSALAAGNCACDESCRKACAEGKSDACGCQHCDCSDCGCDSGGSCHEKNAS